MSADRPSGILRSMRMVPLDEPLDPNPASPKSLGQMFLDAKLIEGDMFAGAEKIAAEIGAPLQRVLVMGGFTSPLTVATMLSFFHRVPVPDLNRLPKRGRTLAPGLIDGGYAHQRYVLPVAVYGRGARRRLLLAMEDPSDAATIAEVQQRIGMPVQPVVSVGNLYQQIETAYPSNPA